MVCAVGSPAEGGPGEAVGGADEGDDGGVGDAVLGGLPGQGFDEFRFADFPDLHGFAFSESRCSRSVACGSRLHLPHRQLARAALVSASAQSGGQLFMWR